MYAVLSTILCCPIPSCCALPQNLQLYFKQVLLEGVVPGKTSTLSHKSPQCMLCFQQYCVAPFPVAALFPKTCNCTSSKSHLKELCLAKHQHLHISPLNVCCAFNIPFPVAVLSPKTCNFKHVPFEEVVLGKKSTLSHKSPYYMLYFQQFGVPSSIIVLCSETCSFSLSKSH